MIITDVRTHILEARLSQPFAYSRAWYDTRTAMVVEIETDQGLIGWGECYGPAPITAAVVKTMAPWLIGEDPLRTDFLWRTIYARLRDHDDAGSRLGLPRVQAEVAGTPGDDGPDVPFPDLIPSECVEDDLRDLLLGVGDLEVDGLRTVEKPVHVPLEFEDPAVVGADPFEDPVPIQQAMVEDADFRLRLRKKLTVNVDA